jgi:hypothetical protein
MAGHMGETRVNGQRWLDLKCRNLGDLDEAFATFAKIRFYRQSTSVRLEPPKRPQ